jgi:hypothetical protein
MSKEERRNELSDSNGSPDWAEMFNGLPREVRRISTALECKTRIQHLNMEKDRLKRRHAQSVKEINDHIANCASHLRQLEKENRENSHREPSETVD